jgi:hypothetical protein
MDILYVKKEKNIIVVFGNIIQFAVLKIKIFSILFFNYISKHTFAYHIFLFC